MGGDKLAVGIGVAMAVDVDHGIDDGLRDLGSGRAVEVDDGAAIDYPF